MIKVKCDRCGKELKRLGALVFSPPVYYYRSAGSLSNEVQKYHICIKCYVKLVDWIGGK